MVALGGFPDIIVQLLSYTIPSGSQKHFAGTDTSLFILLCTLDIGVDRPNALTKLTDFGFHLTKQ